MKRVEFFADNPVVRLLGTRYPIIQGGLAWCSGWELASAVASAGGLGLIGAGSMDSETLRVHIRKAKAAVKSGVFGVNIPIQFKSAADHIRTVMEEGVRVVFTSAGNPKTFTSQLQQEGIVVGHVVPSAKFGRKAEDAGVNLVVGEGFEAGGHNGYEEITTMVLIPQLRAAVQLPVVAAGGIASGASMLAAMALGADGVQLGSRFVASQESSAHPAFKQAVVEAAEDSTFLTLKEFGPVRMLKNAFFQELNAAYARGASKEELSALLGRGRPKRGMFEGDIEQGELEIGQIAGALDGIPSAKEIIDHLLDEYAHTRQLVCSNPSRF